ncbi:membrane-associated tyrosine- and threonine-specific cdc2-inhibitory kinase-like [Eurytemora carolleeae]|uniref:membrane-associated tyrosine- and threonine-specific cdc2-inhibitory kinase-like n=1 Tax=Eurytemora carolleeae TaxID=1294199 RepID=UPI000C786822|nr:membrane-associated tyrosine- and threonine-specific cdc2-inhibitory kinase-like [Eurytemora carolleeae]|eukprot:XP_023331856.1 membrane-associated tyrosine- and threonine-specific cdc2-inhibitory kinase-like [Eurytemora affinis]
MVELELDNLDTSPFTDQAQRDIKASTPADRKNETPSSISTPNNPPPARNSLTSLPRPLFRDEPQTFSTKKERRGTHLSFKRPPRPPAKSCPPKSRIFKTNVLYKAQAVTFLDSPDGSQVTGSPLNSKLYDTRLKKSYYQQAFIVESEIGAGYFGTVYRKCLGFRVRKHQFLPVHNNLVKFYSSWEEEGRLYQQFELCNGTLQDYCETHNNIGESLVWGYLVDLLQAVQHLHNHNLIHMDIKPDNIFFGVDGRCKMGDFGLIVDLTSQDREGFREGDSKYLAPEVLKGNISKSCDIFSLGVTILEVACDLDLPSKGQLWRELRSKGPDLSLTLQLSPELRRVIQLMMTQDPDRRPSVNQILELPSVAQALRRREREVLVQRCISKLLSIFHPLVLLLTWFLGYLENLFSWRPDQDKFKLEHTPPAEPVKHWVTDAYSDDEHDCTLSSAGSDLAAPLQESTSSWSRDSSPELTNEKPESSPLRRPASSPGPRSRLRSVARTPLLLTRSGFRSPHKRLFLDGMEQSPTPGGKEEEEEELQLSLHPQNLASTFNCFSDDDE